MKGPAFRLLIDVRRIWKCPRCGYEEHVGAQTTSVACPCCQGILMKLIEQDRVYADELQQLRDRPKMGLDDEEAADESVTETQLSTPVESVASDQGQPANESSEQQKTEKRRGKRPRKQSRRGRNKQQAEAAQSQPSDSEE